ncbi:MAG: hypothetical protein ACYCPM_00645, partial [Acidobacteriaceae bacterium]
RTAALATRQTWINVAFVLYLGAPNPACLSAILFFPMQCVCVRGMLLSRTLPFAMEAVSRVNFLLETAPIFGL